MWKRFVVDNWVWMSLIALMVSGFVMLIVVTPLAEAQPLIVDEQYLGGDVLQVYELIIEEKDLECVVIIRPGLGLTAHCWKIIAYP